MPPQEQESIYVRIVNHRRDIIATETFSEMDAAKQYAAHMIGQPGAFLGAMIFQLVGIAWSNAPAMNFAEIAKVTAIAAPKKDEA